MTAKPLPLPSDQAALFFVPTIPNGRGGLVIDLVQRNISSTPLIHPNMVYACESVGCHDIFHSRIEKRKERHVRISPDATVDKARLLESLGWQVHITDSVGRQFGVSEFYRFLWINRATAPDTVERRQ